MKSKLGIRNVCIWGIFLVLLFFLPCMILGETSEKADTIDFSSYFPFERLNNTILAFKDSSNTNNSIKNIYTKYSLSKDNTDTYLVLETSDHKGRLVSRETFLVKNDGLYLSSKQIGTYGTPYVYETKETEGYYGKFVSWEADKQEENTISYSYSNYDYRFGYCEWNIKEKSKIRNTVTQVTHKGKEIPAIQIDTIRSASFKAQSGRTGTYKWTISSYYGKDFGFIRSEKINRSGLIITREFQKIITEKQYNNAIKKVNAKNLENGKSSYLVFDLSFGTSPILAGNFQFMFSKFFGIQTSAGSINLDSNDYFFGSAAVRLNLGKTVYSNGFFGNIGLIVLYDQTSQNFSQTIYSDIGYRFYYSKKSLIYSDIYLKIIMAIPQSFYQIAFTTGFAL